MTNTTICPSTILDRVKLILTNPAGCWTTISGENKPAKELLISYTLPLVVMSALAGALGMQIFGVSMAPLGTWRPGIGITISTLVSQTILGIVFPLVSAWIVQKVAAFFNGSATFDKAYSWIVYSSTPCLVGGILNIYPTLGGLASFLGGIAALYIYFKGIPSMVTVAAEKHVIFFISVFGAALVAGVVISFIMDVLLLTTPTGLDPSMITPR